MPTGIEAPRIANSLLKSPKAVLSESGGVRIGPSSFMLRETIILIRTSENSLSLPKILVKEKRKNRGSRRFGRVKRRRSHFSRFSRENEKECFKCSKRHSLQNGQCLLIGSRRLFKISMLEIS